MADEKKPQTITMDAAALEALIDAKVAARMAAPSKPEPEQFEDEMKRVRGEDRAPPKTWHHECESPLTGSGFKAKIMESRASTLGRVIDLEEYRWPTGIDKLQRDGGIVPNEFAAAIEAPESESGQAVRAKYNHWRYWEFLRRDIAEFCGKPFSRYLLKSEADKRRELDKAPAQAAV